MAEQGEDTPRGAPAGARRSERAALAAELLLALGLLAALWCVDYLPTHDGPQHVFAAHAAQHLDDPGPGYGRFLERGAPVTNLGFSTLFGALERRLPWRPALALALGAQLLVWCTGAFALACAMAPGRAWLGVALSAAALQWSLYMGLFSFHLACGLGLAAVALGAAAPRWSARRSLALAALLLAQAACHVVPAIATGFVLAALALALAAPGERARALARVAAIGAPAATVAVALARVGLATLGDLHQGTGASSAPGPAPWWAIAKCLTSGPAWRAWPLTLLALAAPLVALARRPARLRRADLALLVAGAALLAAAVALPLHIRAWDFFSVRLLPLGVGCLVVTLPFDRLAPAPRRAAAAAIALFAAASTGWAAHHHRTLAARAADALAGLDAPLARRGPRLPIVLDPYLGRPYDNALADVPYAVPLANLGALYAVAHGGVPPYGFYLNPHIHEIVLRDAVRASYPRVPDRLYASDLARPERAGDTDMRRAVVAWAAGHGAAYEDVILLGRPDDVDWLLSLGFTADFRRGGLAVARFEGCPVTLTFPPGGAARGRTVVEIGWSPAWHATRRYAVGGGRTDADGTVRLALRETPCGAMWLRLDDDGRVCEGSDAQGRLLVASTRETPVVACRARRAAGPPTAHLPPPAARGYTPLEPTGSASPRLGAEVAAPPDGTGGAPWASIRDSSPSSAAARSTTPTSAASASASRARSATATAPADAARSSSPTG
jgi:hypothetical protein